MLDANLLQQGQELNVIEIDETRDRVTYKLGRDRSYRWSDPEEQVRAEMLLSLIIHYDYSPQRIETEVKIALGRSRVFADIVVFQNDDRTAPYITVEVASPDTTEAERSEKIEQLFGYANALASPYAIYQDIPTSRQCWELLDAGSREREANIVSDVPRNYGTTPTYNYVRGTATDLEAVSANALSHIFDRCHQELWAGGRRDPLAAFDEMSKLIFAKLHDENRTPAGVPYEFQWGQGETDIVVANRVRALFDKAHSAETRIFAHRTTAEARKIANVVRLLQRVSLRTTDLDAKGRAFEQFLGEVFRGRLGQYFTRREIVEFAVALTRPRRDDIVLDPACGSGGFLVHVMKHIFQDIEDSYSGDATAIVRLKDEFARQNIFGIEINETIARVAMMDMVINDDGHSNIEIRSAFDAAFDNAGLFDGRFSLILTNPPFGDTVDARDRDKLGNADLGDYILARGKSSAKPETLFTERIERFLKENGRVAMIVPDGLLSNPTDKHVREFLLDRFHIMAVVGLPQFAFRTAGSGMKTSILLARKWGDGEVRSQDYTIFMATADQIGYDATGRPTTNDLPQLLLHYQNGTGTLAERVIHVRRSDLAGRIRLDPMYYYLGPIIERGLAHNEHPSWTLRDIADEPIQSGKSPSGGATYSSGDIPIILVGDVTPDGTIELTGANYVDDEFYETNRQRASVQPLDILIAKDGATTGKVGLVPATFGPPRCVFNEHLFRLKVGATLPGDDLDIRSDNVAERRLLNTWYIFLCLRSQLAQMQIRREVSGGAQGGITKEFIENVRLPIAPLEQRRNFVADARRKFDEYINALERSRALRAEFDSTIDHALSG